MAMAACGILASIGECSVDRAWEEVARGPSMEEETNWLG